MDTEDGSDDRGFNTSLSPDDLTITLFITIIWLFLMTPLYYTLIQSNPFSLNTQSNPNAVAPSTPSVSSTQNSFSKSKLKSKQKEKKEDVLSWRLGFTAATLFFLREFVNSMVWITWISTYDYDSTSACYIFDVLLQFVNAFAISCLYLYFILRLYKLYSNGVIVQYSNKIYIGLVAIDIGLFVSMILLCTSWIWWDVAIYARANLAALFCEFIMAISMGVLFSRPLIKLSAKTYGMDKFSAGGKSVDSINSGAAGGGNSSDVNDMSDIDDAGSPVGSSHKLKKSSVSTTSSRDRSETTIDKMRKDKLLNLSTKLLILSGIALGSTTIFKIMNFSAYEYCANVGDAECWFVYVSYSLWPLDASLNIFCILCAFKNGNKYYMKICHKLHEFVLLTCVGKYFDKEVERTHSNRDVAPYHD